jgi:hypothetical protein
LYHGVTEIVPIYGKGVTDRNALSDESISAPNRLRRHFAALNKYYSSCKEVLGRVAVFVWHG